MLGAKDFEETEEMINKNNLYTECFVTKGFFKSKCLHISYFQTYVDV